MKKTHIIILFFCFLSVTIHAQKSFIGLSSGVSVPLGEFAKSEYGTLGHEENTAGFAKTGFNISLEGAYYFCKYIGLGGVAAYINSGSLNKTDVDKLAAGYTDAFAVDESTVSTSKSYQLFNVLIGPYFALPLSNKFSLEARALAGLLKGISTPQIDVVLEDPTDPAQHFSQNSSSASALAFQFGLGAKYAFTEKIAITLRGDYMLSNGLKIDNENRRINAGRLVEKQPLSSIQINLGLAYVLGK